MVGPVPCVGKSIEVSRTVSEKLYFRHAARATWPVSSLVPSVPLPTGSLTDITILGAELAAPSCPNGIDQQDMDVSLTALAAIPRVVSAVLSVSNVMVTVVDPRDWPRTIDFHPALKAGGGSGGQRVKRPTLTCGVPRAGVARGLRRLLFLDSGYILNFETRALILFTL
jgi:hypothetical protein